MDWSKAASVRLGGRVGDGTWLPLVACRAAQTAQGGDVGYTGITG